MFAFLHRLRARLVAIVDRLGWRDQALALQGALNPSPRVRRDRRDTRQLRALLPAVVGPNDLCVDVGANVGSVAAEMVRVAPGVAHVLVEPLPDLRPALTRRFPHCEVVTAALTDREGTGTFVAVSDRPTRSGLRPNMRTRSMRSRTITVELTTLDRVLGGRPTRLVKIDVEGTELEVLRGARETLARHRPVVVFEHQPRDADALAESRAIHRLLAVAGYRLFDIDGNGPFDEAAFVATARRGRVWTFLAHADRPGAERGAAEAGRGVRTAVAP